MTTVDPRCRVAASKTMGDGPDLSFVDHQSRSTRNDRNAGPPRGRVCSVTFVGSGATTAVAASNAFRSGIEQGTE